MSIVDPRAGGALSARSSWRALKLSSESRPVSGLSPDAGAEEGAAEGGGCAALGGGGAEQALARSTMASRILFMARHATSLAADGPRPVPSTPKTHHGHL